MKTNLNRISPLRRAGHTLSGVLPAAFLALAGPLLALTLAGCGGDGGGMFENVTIDPARERVNALEEDTDAAERTVNSFFAACDQEDADRLASLFTERAEVYLDGALAMPAEEYVQSQKVAWESRETTVTEVDLRGASLKRPYGWAKAIAHIQIVVGDPHEIRQAVTFGLARRGETWMISHLHISSADVGPGA